MPYELFSAEYTYQKTLTTATNYNYRAPLTNTMRSLRVLMQNDGFDVTAAPHLDGLRLQLARDEREPILQSVGVNSKHILPTMTQAQVLRACAVKFLRHVYMVRQAGARSVWVVSIPQMYNHYVSNELYNHKDSPLGLHMRLEDTNERFTAQQKQLLGTGTNLALRWCQLALRELTLASLSSTSRGRRLVRRWFTGPTRSDARVDRYINELIAGLRRIIAVLNSNKIIFTDMPSLRNSTNADDQRLANAMAFVFGSRHEGLPIIYIENSFFTNSYLPLLETCAQTIIHEITHLELGTSDHAYDFNGLTPDDKLTPRQAMENADSWGYFCCNAARAMSVAAMNRML
jgi:hypothetical protein